MGHRSNVGAGDVAAIDEELADVVRRDREIITQKRDTFLFRSVRRHDCARQDEVGVDIHRDVRFEAVEALRFALSPVAHVGVLDRNASVLGDALSDARFSAGRLGVEVLSA